MSLTIKYVQNETTTKTPNKTKNTNHSLRFLLRVGFVRALIFCGLHIIDLHVMFTFTLKYANVGRTLHRFLMGAPIVSRDHI